MKFNIATRLLVVCLLVLSGEFIIGCAPKKQPVVEPVVVPEPTDYEHTVKYSGETLALISLWYTKESNNWHAILDANPGLDVKRMSIGQIIKIPSGLIKEQAPMPRSFVGRATKKKPEETLAPNAGELIDPTTGQPTTSPAGDVGAGNIAPGNNSAPEMGLISKPVGNVDTNVPNTSAPDSGAPSSNVITNTGTMKSDGIIGNDGVKKTPPAWVDPATETWGTQPEVKQPATAPSTGNGGTSNDRSKLLDELLQ